MLLKISEAVICYHSWILDIYVCCPTDSIDTKSALESIRDLVVASNSYIAQLKGERRTPNRILLKNIATYVTKMFKVKEPLLSFCRYIIGNKAWLNKSHNLFLAKLLFILYQIWIAWSTWIDEFNKFRWCIILYKLEHADLTWKESLKHQDCRLINICVIVHI